MSIEQVGEMMGAYLEALVARGDYGRFFADDVRFEVVGTDQSARGAESTEQAIRFLHEIAFDARPEVTRMLVDDHGAAAEAVFVGTHIGDFSGISATGNAVRLPYSVFYDVEAGTITALRLYMRMDQLLEQIGTAADTRAAGPTA